MKAVIDLSEALNVDIDIKKLLEDNHIPYTTKEEGYLIEEVLDKLITDIMIEVVNDITDKRSDNDSKMYNLELVSNLNQVLCSGHIDSIKQIEYFYRAKGLSILHDELEHMLS